MILQGHKKRHRVFQNLRWVLAINEKGFRLRHIAQESAHSFLSWSSAYCSSWCKVTSKFSILLREVGKKNTAKVCLDSILRLRGIIRNASHTNMLVGRVARQFRVEQGILSFQINSTAASRVSTRAQNLSINRSLGY